MNTLINLAARFTGLSRVLEKMQGTRTKVGALGLMLAGLGMMGTGAAAIATAGAACGDAACGVELVKGLGGNASALLVGKGYLTFKLGLMGFGIGAKLEAQKAAAAQSAQSPQL